MDAEEYRRHATCGGVGRRDGDCDASHPEREFIEWVDPAIDVTYDDVWEMLMDGLCVAKSPG